MVPVVFEKIHSGLFAVSRVAVWIGGLALLLSAFMVTADVLSRKVFGVTMSGSDEITGYVFAAATTWSYAYCLFSRANIRIDALYNLTSLKVRAALDLLGIVLLFFYIVLLTRNALGMYLDNLEFDSTAQTTLATPLWIPQTFWLSGLFFFALCLGFVLLYMCACLLRRDWQQVRKIAGIRSVEEEISDETHA